MADPKPDPGKAAEAQEKKGPRCGDCGYWLMTNEAAGTCHRHAPVAVIGGAGTTTWASTGPDDWCGDYSPRK